MIRNLKADSKKILLDKEVFSANSSIPTFDRVAGVSSSGPRTVDCPVKATERLHQALASRPDGWTINWADDVATTAQAMPTD